MKVLLVDDDAFLRDMYATKFIESGHTVEGVGDVNQALAKVKDTEYDIVLLDMIMPTMSGLELLGEIVKQDLKRNTKFIILSNQSETSNQSSAREAGAVGYIIKAESIPSDVVRQVEELSKT